MPYQQPACIPFTMTIPLMGIHSLDPSGRIVGLLRVGRASKCSCTRVAIRNGNSILLAGNMCSFSFLFVVFDIRRLSGHVLVGLIRLPAHRTNLPRDNLQTADIHAHTYLRINPFQRKEPGQINSKWPTNSVPCRTLRPCRPVTSAPATPTLPSTTGSRTSSVTATRRISDTHRFCRICRLEWASRRRRCAPR